jgi:hypothetical protein
LHHFFERTVSTQLFDPRDRLGALLLGQDRQFERRHLATSGQKIIAPLGGENHHDEHSGSAETGLDGR